MGLASVSYADTVTFTYTEPTQNQAGNPITNLKETTVYFSQNGGAEQIVKAPASALTGGGVITKVVTIASPLPCTSTTITAQVTASNTNVTNFESVRSGVVTGTRAAGTVGCSTPNAPFNLTITIP
jgi:hypothetical protein